MAELIAIVGPPGRGKSTAVFPNKELGITGLDPEKTVIINVSGKSLSMKGWQKVYPVKSLKEGGHHIITHDPSVIMAAMDYIDKSLPNIENIVVEDFQYIMGFMTMDKALETGLKHWCPV